MRVKMIQISIQKSKLFIRNPISARVKLAPIYIGKSWKPKLSSKPNLAHKELLLQQKIVLEVVQLLSSFLSLNNKIKKNN